LNFELDFKSDVDRKQKMSDLQVVALSLAAEFMSINSENSLFKEINRKQISNLIEQVSSIKENENYFYFRRSKNKISITFSKV
jgi:hypothetical protein